MSSYFQEMDNAYKDIINSAWQNVDVKTPKADGDYQVSIIEAKLQKSRKGGLFQYFTFLFQEGDYKNQTLDNFWDKWISPMWIISKDCHRQYLSIKKLPVVIPVLRWAR